MPAQDERHARAAAASDSGRRPRLRRTLCGGLVLQRQSAETLQEQIFTFFREAIVAGRLRRGWRLPSSRDLAKEYGISRTTVVEAYERLVAEGYLEARPRAGIFVARVLPEEFFAPTGQVRASPATRPPGGAVTANASATGGYQDHPLAPGVPAIDRFPWNVWARLSADVVRRESARMSLWADPRGELPLREAIAEYLGAVRGIACSTEQVIVANGSQPIVETLARALAAVGDAVWCEEPGDPAARAVLAALGLRPVPVPVDDCGLDVEQGERLAPHARLALVASSHHYPLGVTMSLERRRALLAWAARSGAWIVENEIDGDYRFVQQAQPSLFALDTAGRTVFLGSFNKTLAPGLRIGYAVVPAVLVPAFTTVAPMVGVQHQLLLARFWADGHLVAYLRHLREVHARRRDLLLEALQREAADLVCRVAAPEAGLRVPVLFDDGAPDHEIAQACRSAGVHVGRPVSICYAGAARAAGLILGFASTPEERIRPAVRTLAGIIAGYARRRGGTSESTARRSP